MALALADNAFENKFTSLAQIYKFVVPSDTDRIRLKWNSDWAGRPVFRDVEKTADGTRISQTRALQYPKHRHHFVRLGRSCGYRKRLEFYDLRRGSGKRLNEALTPEERRQVMGNRGDVYERYYMPAFIDADYQAIYLGSTRRDDFMRAVGRLERHALAPSELTDVQKREIWNDADIIKLIQARERCAQKIKKRDSHGDAIIRASHALLEKTINKFHETVHITEVDRQMQGILPAPDVLILSTIEYELEERVTIARLLFQPRDNLDEDQVFHVRIQLVQTLVQLSKRQATPHQFKTPTSSKWRSPPAEKFQELCKPPQVDHTVMGIDAVANLDHVANKAQDLSETANLYCAFRRWGDEEVGPRKRKHMFSRIDSLERHIRSQHFTRRTATGFHCPYQRCSAF
ncbi:hypothetical protein LSUE1_G002969 [Lachnellula suecica]|uniref:Uncharacterized protein n=1 Tax=Lachnellula suecica TaxID=602035 RepID=A0A8T9CCS2_9HELO|nr:hypothetical protein LSUE1_G002969 [Lachnellula suecica]